MDAVSSTPGLKNETNSATRSSESFGLRVLAVKNLLKKMGKESKAEVFVGKIEKELEAEKLLKNPVVLPVNIFQRRRENFTPVPSRFLKKIETG